MAPGDLGPEEKWLPPSTDGSRDCAGDCRPLAHDQIPPLMDESRERETDPCMLESFESGGGPTRPLAQFQPPPPLTLCSASESGVEPPLAQDQREVDEPTDASDPSLRGLWDPSSGLWRGPPGGRAPPRAAAMAAWYALAPWAEASREWPFRQNHRPAPPFCDPSNWLPPWTLLCRLPGSDGGGDVAPFRQFQRAAARLEEREPVDCSESEPSFRVVAQSHSEETL
mmetsp:Transcript_12858/g.42728  ORF Transcript_12858/g.42728 Transcript_12858/m.42728 type:complete len:226 (+) Transcript_12858:400-1077(+)